MTNHILIKGQCIFKYMNWAQRFIFVYAQYNGHNFTFPVGDKLEAISENGTVTLKVDTTLKETHPKIFEHALSVGRLLDCSIEEN